MEALLWYVTPPSTGMEADCSVAATEDGIIVSFCWPRQDVIIKVNLHTPRICEENVALDGLWEYMFGPCSERCDVGFCFVFDMAMFGPCMERCDVGFCLAMFGP